MRNVKLLLVLITITIFSGCEVSKSVTSKTGTLDDCSDAKTRISQDYDQNYYINGNPATEDEAAKACKEVQALKRARLEPGLNIKPKTN